MKPIKYTGLYCARCGRRQEEQDASSPCVTPKCNSLGFSSSLRAVPWDAIMRLPGNKKFLRDLRIDIGTSPNDPPEDQQPGDAV